MLHDEPYVVFIQERVDILDDVRVKNHHYRDFVEDEVPVRLLVEVRLLDDNSKVGANLTCSGKASKRAISEVDNEQMKPGLTRDTHLPVFYFDEVRV